MSLEGTSRRHAFSVLLGPRQGSPEARGKQLALFPQPNETIRRIPGALLIAFAAILSATTAWRAESLSTEARAAWSEAATMEKDRAAYMTRTADYVLGLVGPMKVAEAKDFTLLSELERAKERWGLREVPREIQTLIRSSQGSLEREQGGVSFLADSDSYLSEPGQYRFAEHLHSEVEAVGNRDVLGAQRHGNRQFALATLAMSLTIPTALAFLLAVGAQVARSGRGRLLTLGSVCLLAVSAAVLLATWQVA